MASALIASILGIVASNFVIPTIKWGITKLANYLYGSTDKEERKDVQATINVLSQERKGLRFAEGTRRDASQVRNPARQRTRATRYAS